MDAVCGAGWEIVFLRYYSLVVFYYLWLDVPAGVVSLV
jgi:hypothetical protein